MKQHIDPEQIDQLTPEAKKRLLEWFNEHEPEDGIVRVYIPEEAVDDNDGVFAGFWEGEYEFTFPEPYVGKLSNHQGTIYPLLSIGEIIEVLDKHISYYPQYYVHHPVDQICDAMWGDLTDVLKEAM